MPDLLISHKCNDIGFTKVTLAKRCHFHTIVQVYKILNHLVPGLYTFGTHSCIHIHYIGTLLVLLERTVIIYLFLECRPLMD